MQAFISFRPRCLCVRDEPYWNIHKQELNGKFSGIKNSFLLPDFSAVLINLSFYYSFGLVAVIAVAGKRGRKSHSREGKNVITLPLTVCEQVSSSGSRYFRREQQNLIINTRASKLWANSHSTHKTEHKSELSPPFCISGDIFTCIKINNNESDLSELNDTLNACIKASLTIIILASIVAGASEKDVRAHSC